MFAISKRQAQLLHNGTDLRLGVELLSTVATWRLRADPDHMKQRRVNVALSFWMISTHASSHLCSGSPAAAQDTAVRQESAKASICLRQLKTTSVMDVQESSPGGGKIHAAGLGWIKVGA